ncbi:MAG: S1C family serine protease [Phycisphaerae bacterium]
MSAPLTLAWLIGLSSITAPATVTPPAGRPSGAANGFSHAIDSVLPRVVKLYGLGAGLQAGYGSGVIVSPDGQVLTVFSLLIDARRIRAVAWDGRDYGATVLYRDRRRQLALLQLTPPDAPADATSTEPVGPLPYFDLSQETTLTPGDWILAAGNAFKVATGAEPVSLAHGIFSIRTRLDARRRLKDFPYRGDVLVIDAIAANPGAPGSAVVNLDGRFVGMIGRVVTSNLTHTHFNYALPRDVLHEFLEQARRAADEGSTGPRMSLRSRRLERTAARDRRDPGIRLSRVGYRTVLPFVDRVRPDSPAHRAGVRKDDLILSVNGRSVPDAAAYDKRLATLSPGEPLKLVIRRGNEILSLRIDTEKP